MVLCYNFLMPRCIHGGGFKFVFSIACISFSVGMQWLMYPSIKLLTDCCGQKGVECLVYHHQLLTRFKKKSFL